MSLNQFLECLFSDGKLRVGQIEPIDSIDFRAAEDVLLSFESQYRLDFPGIAPTFNVSAAVWSSFLFYRACQFSLFREYDEHQMQGHLSYPFNSESTPSIHYSVDLVFKFLPEFVVFIQALSDKDPLVNFVNNWATDWPLSSVGMTNLKDLNTEVIAQHSGLLRLYVERIIKKNDKTRISEECVQQELKTIVGSHIVLSDRVNNLILEEIE